jgi:hypothetical protein
MSTQATQLRVIILLYLVSCFLAAEQFYNVVSKHLRTLGEVTITTHT